MSDGQQHWRSHLKSHVSNILARKNEEIEYFYREESDNIMKILINPESFTLSNFAYSLKTIASHTFSVKGWTHYHVIVLFLYCIKIDEICIKTHDWYKTNLLEEVLVDILIMIDYSPPSRCYYYYCTVIPLFLILSFLIYFVHDDNVK